MYSLGNIIFLLGVGILILAGLGLPFWNKFDSSFIPVIMTGLVAGAVIILIGEMMRQAERRQRRKSGDNFMDYYRQNGGRSRDKRIKRIKAESGTCAFCGAILASTPISSRPAGRVSGQSDIQAGQCEECSKISCPQCAFKKGLEMGLRSFRCPACGGRIL